MNEVNQILKDLPEGEKLYIILDSMSNLYNAYSEMIEVCKVLGEEETIPYYEDCMKNIMDFITKAQKTNNFMILDPTDTKIIEVEYSDRIVEFEVEHKSIVILPYDVKYDIV